MAYTINLYPTSDISFRHESSSGNTGYNMINETENAINLTIPYNLVNTTYYNGQKLTANKVVSIPVNTSKRFDVLLVQNGSNVYAMINEL